MVGRRILWCLSLVLVAVWPARSLLADDICKPEVLEQKAMACGLDMTCVNELMADYNEQCAGGQGMPGVGSMAGMGGMGNDAMAKIQACGTDQECLKRVGDEIQEDFHKADPDTTKRLSERTVLSPSWLQMYQEALVACGKSEACWLGHMYAAYGHINGACGSNMMNEATLLCQIAARYEIHIEQAIAQQRLWLKGVRFQGDAPGAQPPAEPGSGDAGSGSGDPVELPEQGGAGLKFVPEVTHARIAQILAKWEPQLVQKVAEETRETLEARAQDYPVEGEEGMPPLIYEEQEVDGESALEARATRRDWYYALTAVLLTEVGLSVEGDDGKTLLDTAFWCLVQAAQLKPEVEHFSNLGFHLNLRGKVEEARDVLAYAHKLDDKHPDALNNMAFSYAAMGKEEEALELQKHAFRLDPENGHIQSRLHAMLGKSKQAEKMPYGGDFGEAFFRLGKRHTLREYAANKAWFNAREKAKHAAFGGTPVVPGPASWYQEQIHDIEESYRACLGMAPEVLKGCPFGAGIVHPSCANAPSAKQVERSQHNYNVHVCQCRANDLMARADALSAWLDRSLALWQEHEKAWWPRLQSYLAAWSADIKRVNKQYAGTNFIFPVKAGYAYWPEEFAEDSEEAWTDDIPDIAQRWYDLKTEVQKLKSCGTKLPPIKKPPKKPKPAEPPKVKSWSINLFVVEFSLSMDGSFKAAFDLGIVKGGYERIAGVDGHKITVGSGSIEFSYQHNGAPMPGQDTSQVSFTVGANFFKFIPGAGKPAAAIADQFFSFGSKFEGSWGNNTGWSGKTAIESKSKFGFSSRDVTLTPSTRMLN